MTETTDHVQLAKRAVDQIRDALCTLGCAADGWYEDESQVALDALDWLEEHLGLHLLRDDPPAPSDLTNAPRP